MPDTDGGRSGTCEPATPIRCLPSQGVFVPSRIQSYVITYAADEHRGRQNLSTSARASARCARRWTCRCATSPSAAASRRRCCRRSSAARPARRSSVAAKIAAGLELTPLAAAAPGRGRRRHRRARRRSASRAAARDGHRYEVLTPPLPGPARRGLPAHAGARSRHRRPGRPADARGGQPRDGRRR